MHTPHITPSHRHGHGFTLVELMVAMALGLITTLIIAQVLIASEGNRRTAMEGSDAQVNGSVGLYSVSRDLQMAGYGIISHAGALGCPIKAKHGSAATLDFTLAPVSISNDANGNPTLRVLSAGRSSFSVPMMLKADHSGTSSAFTVNSTLGVSDGDVVMVVPSAWTAASWCSVYQVAQVAGTNPLNSTSVPHAAGSNSWNQPADAGVAPSTSYTADNAFLVNLGRMVLREYRVNNNNLVMRELQADGTWGDEQILASSIVTMRVLYGRDTSAARDGIVDVYDNSTPTTADGWSRVLTVRIALVARSEQRERNTTDGTAGAVTTDDPLWDVGTATPVSGTEDCPGSETRQCLSLPLPRNGNDDTEWQQYRYKVYDTVVPLRNVLWSAT